MKTALYIAFGIVFVVMIAFYLLGKKSQNGAAIGLLNGALAPCSGKPNCVNSEAGTPDKFKVKALRNTDIAAVQAAIETLGGVVTKSQNGYLSAEFTSGIFKFVDDVEARKDGDMVHIRSASRVGYSDRGVNRARVEAIRTHLDNHLNKK